MFKHFTHSITAQWITSVDHALEQTDRNSSHSSDPERRISYARELSHSGSNRKMVVRLVVVCGHEQEYQS